jgi:hypothetical protein
MFTITTFFTTYAITMDFDIEKKEEKLLKEMIIILFCGHIRFFFFHFRSKLSLLHFFSINHLTKRNDVFNTYVPMQRKMFKKRFENNV